MDFLTHIISKLYMVLFSMLIVALPVSAQEYGKLTVQGQILCDKKDKSVMSSVTIYRYYHASHSIELVKQDMVPRDGGFKFRLEYDKDYIIDVASNTGVHKRINLNTEVMKGYKYENQQYAFEVDVRSADYEEAENVAWIYFDPSKNDFNLSNQMPVAWQER